MTSSDAKNTDAVPANTDEFSRYRKLTGISKWIQTIISTSVAVIGLVYILKLHLYLGIPIYAQQWIGLFLTLVLILAFMSLPMSARSPRDRVPWYDIIFSLLAIPVGLWLTINYPKIINIMGVVTTERVVLGAIAVLLLLEAARRLVGLTLVIVGVIFILYAKYSTALPGLLAGMEVSWGELFNYLYIDPSSMLGMLSLAATFGLAFVFFGQVLLKFGGADALTNLSLLILGRTRGGPAKVAVIGSSLVGTMTGAPMSNVFLTGNITIPMMIRTGYQRHFAGAVEAVASSGGQLMPPVMGIAAFLIAEQLGVAYAEVALAALIPAVLFYIAIFIQVDLEAGKLNLKGLSKDELPLLKKTLVEAIPISIVLLVLIYLMFIVRMDPAGAGVISGVIAIVLLLIKSEYRQDILKRIHETLHETGLVMLDVTAALGIAGLVVGAISVSGLGFTLGYILVSIGEHSLALLLIASAIGCIILGMGMPSVAAYALVAVLVAPALVEFGIHPMAAHLFIFYYAIVSNFTPPIAVAAFAGAAIARTSPMKTGWTATRLGVLAYIIPFLFVFSPSLILQGTWWQILLSFVTAVIGTWLIGMGLTGYLFRTVSAILRVLLLASGVMLLIPMSGFDITLLINVIGLLLGLIIVLTQLVGRKRQSPSLEEQSM